MRWKPFEVQVKGDEEEEGEESAKAEVQVEVQEATKVPNEDPDGGPSHEICASGPIGFPRQPVGALEGFNSNGFISSGFNSEFAFNTSAELDLFGSALAWTKACSRAGR